MSQKRHYSLVILFLSLGFFIRLTSISNFPSGLCQDEASIGYEAFSILKTGLDRNGNSYPVHLKSWGSGQNALYAYLSIPFIHFLGLNTFSVRIVNAIFSCISLLLFFLLFRLMADKRKALAALALFAIFPWSIMSGRWGLECNIFPAFFLSAVFFLIKGYSSNQKYYLLSFLLFAISLYAYGTSYLILPIFFLLILPYLFYTKRISTKYLLVSLSIFIIVSLPIILFVFINQLDLSPIQISNISIPRLDANRTTAIFNLFNDNFIYTLAKNTVRFLSILLLQSDGNEYNAIPAFGTIYPISGIFLFVGLYGVLKNKKFITEPLHFIFIAWLFASFVLGITSHVNINRINIIFIPLLYFVIFGIFEVREMLNPALYKNYKNLLIGLYSVYFILLCGYYITFFNEKIKDEFSYGLEEAIQFADKINSTDSINITNNTIKMPYIYVCFYNKINPEEFRKSVIYDESSFVTGFRAVKKMGRYTFGNKTIADNKIYVVSKTEMSYITSDIAFSKEFGNYYVIKFNQR